MNLNKVIVAGNLAYNPERRATRGGTAVTTFPVATNRSYSDRDGSIKQETEYHQVVAFAQTGESVARYLAKGRPVLVEGRLKTSEYKDKDGITRYRTQVIAERVEFGPRAGGETEGDRSPATASTSTETDEAPEADPEDMPF